MKALIRKLVPGVVATLVATALGMFCMARAQAKASAPVDVSAQVATSNYAAAAPVYNQPPAAPVQQILVCGVCGAQLQQPQAVMVAAPVDGRRGYAQQLERREYQPAYYPEPVCEQPIAYAPAYYQRPISVDPFQEVRVNPIPFPYQTRAVYAAPSGQVHGRR